MAYRLCAAFTHLKQINSVKIKSVEIKLQVVHASYRQPVFTNNRTLRSLQSWLQFIAKKRFAVCTNVE